MKYVFVSHKEYKTFLDGNDQKISSFASTPKFKEGTGRIKHKGKNPNSTFAPLKQSPNLLAINSESLHST